MNIVTQATLIRYFENLFVPQWSTLFIHEIENGAIDHEFGNYCLMVSIQASTQEYENIGMPEFALKGVNRRRGTNCTSSLESREGIPWQLPMDS